MNFIKEIDILVINKEILMGDLLDKVDVLVIGGGVSGCTTLRQLSMFKYEVALVEKHEDVCCECSKAASGFVNSPLYSAMEVGVRSDWTGEERITDIKGREENILHMLAYVMRERFFKDLGIKWHQHGYLLVAFNSKQLEMLRKVDLRVRTLCVSGEFITDLKRIKEIEPNISNEVIGAFYLPEFGEVNPWEVVIALYENARQNGARAHFNVKVTNIIWQRDKEKFLVETERGNIEARYIVNAAGFGAAEIARMIGDDSFLPYGTREEIIILDNTCKGVVNNFVRGMGEDGTFKHWVQPAVDGEIILGRGYFPCKTEEDFHNVSVTREGIEIATSEAKKLLPSLPISQTAIHAYAGIMPKTKVKSKNGYIPASDPIIAGSKKNHRLVNVTFAFVSPAPALGLLVGQALSKAGLNLGAEEENDDFNPIRTPLLRRFSDASNEERAKLIERDPRYGHVVCRCMYVTEAEIVEAIRRGATTYEGVRKRTHVGMGRCQGGFDKPRVLAILAKELGIPQTKVTINGGTSVETMFKSKELLKEKVEELGKRLKYIEPRFDSEELRKSYEELLEEAKDD